MYIIIHVYGVHESSEYLYICTSKIIVFNTN